MEQDYEAQLENLRAQLQTQKNSDDEGGSVVLLHLEHTHTHTRTHAHTHTHRTPLSDRESDRLLLDLGAERVHARLC
jgi:hypothetical protein